MDRARSRADSRSTKRHPDWRKHGQLRQDQNSLLALFGLAVAAAAILVGVGFVGGSGSASIEPAPMPKPRVTGPWRYIADAPQSIAAGRTAVWTGRELIVAGTNPGSDGTFIHSTEVAEAYNPSSNTWRALATPPTTPSYCRRDAVWTGSEMLVWGCNLLAYDPTKNSGAACLTRRRGTESPSGRATS